GAVPLAAVVVTVGRHVHDAGVVHDARLREPLLVIAVLGAFALAFRLALALMGLAMGLAVVPLVGATLVAPVLAVVAALLALLLAIVAVFLALVVARLRCCRRGTEAGDQQGHQCRPGKGSGAGLDIHGVALVRRQVHSLARGPLNVKSA